MPSCHIAFSSVYIKHVFCEEILPFGWKLCVFRQFNLFSVLHTYQISVSYFSNRTCLIKQLALIQHILFMVKKSLLMVWNSLQFVHFINIHSKREALFQRPVFHDAKISLYHLGQGKNTVKHPQSINNAYYNQLRTQAVVKKVQYWCPKRAPQEVGEIYL